MAAKHHVRALPHTPDLSMSDSEDAYSSDAEELPNREEIDGMLRQAHRYVITEGGNDSRSTFMQRINRINQDLIQEISLHGYECDSKLYRHVKQKIDHVLREFEDIPDEDYDHDEVSTLLERELEESVSSTGSSPVTPGRSPTAHPIARNDSENSLQRTYLYGGPHNYPEIVYKTAPASLPFPETFRMADWESLRIHWDLATTGNLENTNPVTSNGIAFNDPRLAHHDRLGQFESGSRFRLPTIDAEVMANVSAYGTIQHLRKSIDEFAQGDDSLDIDGDYKYTPRLFSDRLVIGHQDSPVDRKLSRVFHVVQPLANLITVIDQVRKAINTTPTKRRPSNGSSSRAGLASSTAHSEPKVGADSRPHGFVGDGDDSAYVDSPLQSVVTDDNGVSPAILRIKAATKQSILSSTLPQSPPITSPVAAHGSMRTTKASVHTHRGTVVDRVSPQLQRGQTTTSGKRKRLSVDVADAEMKTAQAKRSRTTDSAELRTPSVAPQAHGLPTPSSTPALTMSGSSVASTPMTAKARASGKKQRKFHTKHDFEERVTPERYAEIMAQRRSNTPAQGHEDVPRGSTRSGKIRMI